MRLSKDTGRVLLATIFASSVIGITGFAAMAQTYVYTAPGVAETEPTLSAGEIAVDFTEVVYAN